MFLGHWGQSRRAFEVQFFRHPALGGGDEITYFTFYYRSEVDSDHLRSLRLDNYFFGGTQQKGTLLLSSGCGRHWPDARGIFHNEAKDFFVWVNEEDHMRIISMEKGDNIKKIFVRFATACNEVRVD